MDVIVAVALTSVIPCNACATHSHPARVDNACWKGAVAAWTRSANCCEIVRATKHLTISPATMLTPPSGFLRAVNRPFLMASLMERGTCALAKNSETWKNTWASLTWSSSGCKCSTVIPVGHPADPRLANSSQRGLHPHPAGTAPVAPNWPVQVAWARVRTEVSWIYPATHSMCSDLPRRRQLSHVHQRFSSSGASFQIILRSPTPALTGSGRLNVAHTRLAEMNSPHSPRTKYSNLLTNLERGMGPPLAGRCNNILGRRKNNFHPRSSWTVFLLR